MDELTLVFVLLIVVFVALRVLNLGSRSTAPTIISGKSERIRRVIAACRTLHEVYAPPLFWAKQGHFQTLLYGIKGRFRSPSPRAYRRIFLRMSDGATSTFDLFKPLRRHPSGRQVTVCVCPGIGNSSDTNYIRTMVQALQRRGFRCAVLNHLGVPPGVRLTSPRIFSYGSTEELASMVSWLRSNHPSNQLVGVGLSMGANVLTKFLGENKKNQRGFIGALSVCQGYDVEKGTQMLTEWKYSTGCGMLFYMWNVSQLLRGIMARHKDQLFSRAAERRYGTKFNLDKIFSPFSLLNELDEEYTMKIYGFTDLTQFYRAMSSARVLDQIEIPMCFVNALDDPMVPVELQEIGKETAKNSDNSFHVTTKFGGHLGFFEGTFFPRSLTWMDRLIVDYSDALVAVEETGENKILKRSMSCFEYGESSKYR